MYSMASAQNAATTPASQSRAKHRRAALTPAARGRGVKAALALAVLVMLVAAAAFASAETSTLREPSRALQRVASSGLESQEVREGGTVQTTINEGRAAEDRHEVHRGRNLKKKKKKKRGRGGVT